MSSEAKPAIKKAGGTGKSLEARAGVCNVLVLGVTGHGKSTFINTVVNYFRQGSLDNVPSSIKVAIPTKYLRGNQPESANNSELDCSDQTKSQTSAAVQYFMENKHGSFCFIDTPGFADTEGTKKDDANIRQILDAADDVENLGAIILVVSGRNPRLTMDIMVALSTLQGHIPDVALENIIVVCSNCATKQRCNFVIPSLPFSPKYVAYLDNSAFSADPKKWLGRDWINIQQDWDSAMYVIDQLVKALVTLGSVSSASFASMRKQRDEVKASLHAAQLKITELQKVEDDVLDIEADIIRNKKDVTSFANYTQTKKEKIVSQVPVNYYNTICQNCNKVCHEDCQLGEIAAAGDMRFVGCAAFCGCSHCQMCGGEKRCDHSSHYHARYILTEEEKTLEEVIQDIKDKYDAATAGLSEANNRKSELQKAKTAIEGSIKMYSESVEDSCKSIKDICKGFNFAEELFVTIQKLEAEKKLIVNVAAKKSAGEFIRAIQAIADSLSSNTSIFVPKAAKPGSWIDIEDNRGAPTVKEEVAARGISTVFDGILKSNPSEDIHEKRPRPIVNTLCTKCQGSYPKGSHNVFACDGVPKTTIQGSVQIKSVKMEDSTSTRRNIGSKLSLTNSKQGLKSKKSSLATNFEKKVHVEPTLNVESETGDQFDPLPDMLGGQENFNQSFLPKLLKEGFENISEFVKFCEDYVEQGKDALQAVFKRDFEFTVKEANQLAKAMMFIMKG